MTAWHAIVNPAAGGGRAGRAWPAIEAALQGAGLSVTAGFTTEPGAGAALARAAVAQGARRLLAVGGDGTLSEVALGALGEGAEGPGDLALATWPAGTGRDVAKRLALPSDLGALAQLLARDRVVRRDLALLRPWGEAPASFGPRLVLNVASAGLSAGVLSGLATVPKALPGPLRYALSAICELARPGGHWRPELLVDGAPWPAEAQILVAVALGPTFGGGMHIAPGADDADGLLDVVAVRQAAPWRLLGLLPALYQGQLLGATEVVRHGRAQSVAWAGGAWVEADGELLGPGGVCLTVKAGALPLVG